MQTIMLMGSSACGKTTLLQRLNGLKITYKKTQAIEVINTTIDTPGEYLENRAFYKALVVTATEASLVLFVQDATDERFRFSPGQRMMFSAPVLGVVSKADLATPAQLAAAQELLELAGAEEIFVTSAVTGTGCDALLRRIARG
ncbi:MAG: EutP/PduV family microcompartment system protein [Oscillospiraceae bacterium]|jgi:ethanolamine utilization protein EutP|nr:EutP/PduV family microcompartment system protein [Oscillospiraceae bacterium]